MLRRLTASSRESFRATKPPYPYGAVLPAIRMVSGAMVVGFPAVPCRSPRHQLREASTPRRNIYQLFAPVVGCPRIWLLALRPPYGLLA
nr:MAG TPA: hypothetical protein [Caudoviricetes sp.]